MKKILTITLLFSMVLIISGCKSPTNPIDEPKPDPITCEDNQVLNEQTNECEDIVLTDVHKVDSKNTVDLLSYYSMTNKEIDIFNYLEDDTSYVNIEVFMTQIKSLMSDIAFTIDNGLVLTYSIELEASEAVIYGTNELVYSVTFDAINNQISINDIDFYSVINAPVPTPGSELIIDSIEYFGPPQETIINLDEYEMYIYEEDGNYYLPLYLASLFLTGDAVNVYETDDAILLFDSGSDFNELEYRISTSSNDTSMDILETSENYLKLYFEYFYGLKDELGHDFDSLIESYNLTDKSTFRSYYTSVDAFLTDLDDIHTSFISGGYNDPTYTSSLDFTPGSRWETLFNALDTNKCYFLSEYDYFKDGTTMYVTVNGFTENTLQLVNDVIANSDGVEDVVIDLRCNSGGSLLGVLELMTLLTNQPIPLNIYNPESTLYEKQYIVNFTPRALQANFYVLTSEVTFSGGNLFASFVKDMDAGVLLGTPSSGGACAINLTVLPDGGIFVASSNTVLMNNYDETTEWGITPDVIITNYIEDLTQFDFTVYENN